MSGIQRYWEMAKTALRHPKRAVSYLLFRVLGAGRAERVFMTLYVKGLWIARDYARCSGCRKCEIACSLHHEGRIWPEMSRVKVFMLTPTLEFPHLCAQCPDYPCVAACPCDALSVASTGAVLVDATRCTGCGQCITACPGRVPFIHPAKGVAAICDLCSGDPRCARVCTEGGWMALRVVREAVDVNHALYARPPEAVNEDLIAQLYGEAGERLSQR